MNFDKIVVHDYEKIFYNRFQDIMDKKANYHGALQLMDFGIGEEKEAPNPIIIDALNKATKEKNNNKYSDNDFTIMENEAINYLKRNFNVIVNKKEIMPIMGAKSILAMIPFLFIEKDDYIVTLNPSYVILERATQLKNGKVAYLNLSKENQFYPNLDEIKEEIWEKTKILNLNFPHNPTGAIVDEEFYKKAINYAKKYNFIIVNDAAYLGISYHKPTSFLSIKGAKDVGIEIYTLSKSHNMTGFRMGFVAGNEKLITLLKTLKNNFDSGQYLPIQYAAKEALKHDEITENLKEKYLNRLKKIAMILLEHGIYAYIPYATFYLYFEIPFNIKEVTFKSAKEFASFLLEKAGIMTIPYDENGHYIRLAMTFVSDDDESFYKEFSRRLDLLFF